MYKAIDIRGANSPQLCMIELSDGATLQVPRSANLWHELIEAGYYLPGVCGGKGRCNGCLVDHDSGKGLQKTVSCQTTVEGDLRIEIPPAPEDSGWKVVNDTEESELYLGIDIGTTTIGLYLSDENGNLIATQGILNPQLPRGGDVMTRLSAANDPAVRQKMSDSVKLVIRNRLNSLESETPFLHKDIRRASIVANGAVSLLALGESASQLSFAPYDNPLSGKGSLSLDAEEWGLHGGILLELLSPVEAFLGSDATAGAFIEGLWQAEHPTVYMDLGTNGEVLLAARGKVWATSAAAGPALEGGHLSCGMPAFKGAIERFELRDGRIIPRVIGDGNPKGICGSGVLSLLRLLRDSRILDENGQLDADHADVEVLKASARWVLEGGASNDSQIYLTQWDIREVQLAKAALRAGLDMLLSMAGIVAEDVQSTIITGAFGASLDPADLKYLGIVPGNVQTRIIENGAGMGALKLASNPEMRDSYLESINEIEYTNLAVQDDFQDIFVSRLALGSST